MSKQTAQDKMALLRAGLCDLLFVFPDGSRLTAVSTLNKELLESLGLASERENKLYNLDTNREIPRQYISNLKEVRIRDLNSTEDSPFEISPLDRFISKGLF